jgi:hypothetical protein
LATNKVAYLDVQNLFFQKMTQLASRQLFDSHRPQSGQLKAFLWLTKVTLIVTLGATLYFQPPQFNEFIFDWIASVIKMYMIFSAIALASIWIAFGVLWAFGLGAILNMKAANSFLGSMQSMWEQGFEKYTGVTDRCSVNGFFEDGVVQVDGIAYKKQLIYLMSRGRVFEIPFNQIRSWQWKIETPETVTVNGTGLQASMVQASAVQANLTSAERAFFQSGFFIQIADENTPVLQFHCDDLNTLQRWNEIFMQARDGNI